MVEILRIPLTAEQKRLITDAAKINPSGVAAWARIVLLEAAESQQRASVPKARRSTKGGE